MSGPHCIYPSSVHGRMGYFYPLAAVTRLCRCECTRARIRLHMFSVLLGLYLGGELLGQVLTLHD